MSPPFTKEGLVITKGRIASAAGVAYAGVSAGMEVGAGGSVGAVVSALCPHALSASTDSRKAIMRVFRWLIQRSPRVLFLAVTEGPVVE
jgi:hypothetical protein